MTTFLIIAIIVFICITAAVLDHASGMDRPRSPRKPKKNQNSFFAGLGADDDVHFPK